MALLVRSWNLFHGNTVPPTRRSRLREMIELAVTDSPGVLCLQEVPVWAVPRLAEWSGLYAIPAIARRGLRPAALAGWITRFDNGLLRSAIAGQANAILVAREHETADLGHVQISERGVERRICQVARVEGIIVANLHASSIDGRPELAEAELDRARAFAEGLATGGEPVVIAGDFNLVEHALDGYSSPGSGIDHVLVRGVASTPLEVWPAGRRVQNGQVLSDHAPVELRVG
jgi:endonuclease/exonuclease/phosphatase family metal-dependent hydrolase